MRLHGLQKLTLLDFPEHVACTVFTAGCNLRCPFCHNALLVTDIQQEDAIPEDEFFSFLEKRKGLLEGVAVTGGEPLMQPDLGDFLRRIRKMGFAVKLDTNGTLPGRLAPLLAEGLVDYVAMDVKNVPEKYAGTVGLPRFDTAPIRESMALLDPLEGVKVAAAFVMVDRKEKGQGEKSAVQEVEAAFGFPVYSIATVYDILEYLSEDPRNEEHIARIQAYLAVNGAKA